MIKRIGIKKSGGFEKACALVSLELETKPIARYMRSINSSEITIFHIRKNDDGEFVVKRPNSEIDRTSHSVLSTAIEKQVNKMAHRYVTETLVAPYSETAFDQACKRFAAPYFASGSFLIPIDSKSP